MNRTTVNRRYKIERKIGEGGMAEVYLGHDDLLHRPVAIKSLRAQFAADAGFRTRFEREAQAAASFSHPNIIDIYDVGEDRGTPYIVMEYVPGETLKEIIQNEGPFDPDDVAILIEQVASALDYAHERGFVHRDIKPQNILVDGDGLAKVVDFGIAKGLADSTLTEAGSGLGTVHYVSPEQASGLMATPSSDIYSLAIVSYEMLTGRLPFESDSAVGIAMKHINEQPRHPSQISPSVPRSAGDVVVRALAKDPTKRFTSAGAFAQALNDWRAYESPGGLSVPAPPRGYSQLSAPTIPAIATVADPRREAPAQRRPPVTTPVMTATVVATPNTVRGTETSVDGRGSNLGCASWIVGALVILVLASLVWFGSRLSDRLSGFGSNDDPTATATVEVLAETDQPTPTTEIAPTRTPPIEPAESTQPSGTELIVVPSLLGLSLEEATATLDQLDLVLERGDDETSDSVEEGLIAGQEPEPDAEVEPGTSVKVSVSAGPAAIDLASLDPVGADPDQLEEVLISRGLAVLRRDDVSAEIDTGLVIALEPADAARPGETVTMVISVGDKIRIPSELQGIPLDEARAVIADLGLSIANEIAVSKKVINDAGITDLDQAGIEDQDVVGIQDNEATFGGFVDPGVAVTLVYYDASLSDE